MALTDKLKELSQAIEVKREETKTAWSAFDEKRKALNGSDIDLSNPDDEKTKKALDEADEAMKPYSAAKDQLRTLEGQFERLALMAADDGEKTVDIRKENEHDRHAKEARETFGRKAVESDQYKELVKSGALAAGSEVKFGVVQLTDPMDRAEFKSLLTGQTDSAGGVLNVPERFPGIADLPQLPLGILDLVTVGQTDANAVEFVRILARSIAAAEVAEATESGDIDGVDITAAEGGRKPESGLTFEEALEGVKTIAHWIPATRNQLADAAFLQTLVESELIQGVQRRAESQIVNGSGAGNNIRGILNTPGIASHDLSDNAGDTRADALHRILTLIILAGFSPTAYAVNPLDWEEIRLGKDDNGNYIFGPPSVAGQMQIWGRSVVETPAVAENKAVAGEWSRDLFLVREGAKVLVSDSHKDWFTRNLVALLAEGRGVNVIMRPQAFGEVNFNA